ncbi:MAG TPA: protein kinase [Gemmatimonadales bacterium]|nr:protein kinase [Gemmatimonadales bacterium]
MSSAPPEFTTLADRYRLEREIGRGGMATVYLAQDLKHHRPVAVKILHAELAANVGSDRFLREIEIAARLSHPHILTLIDSGSVVVSRQSSVIATTDDRRLMTDDRSGATLLYYVMPFVEGESLRQRLNRDKRIPLEEAVAIARQVASALAYAHSRGVVHRDIKPENVMLSGGEAIVTDFGIAKAVSGANDNLTQTGTSVGTPAYMSPEQASGDMNLDGRSDLYSLGCVLYEMLAGTPPFTGANAQAVIVKRFTEAPPSLRSARVEVPDAAETAVMRTLARNPADRYSTATELAQALVDSIRVVTPVSNVSTAVNAVAPTKSIAVLPFVDMSPDRDQEYFTDGVAEEIINALSKLEALRVASRTSSFAFKGKSEDIGEIGKKLKVGTVLEGSVRKAGNRLRVTSQLVDVTNGYQLWSGRFDRELEDVFAIQDEIAASITKALSVVLNEDEKKKIERPRSENIEAYEFYLRGRQYFHQFREKALQFARRMFTRAIEIDPGYARAYAGIADCSSMLYHYWDASDANLEQANSASQKALELSPGLAEAHASRGLSLSLSKQYVAAAAEFEKAVQLDPKLYEGYYYYALARFGEGNYREAHRLFLQASAVRPEDFQAAALGALSLAALGDPGEMDAYRSALAIMERHLELNPEDARALYLGSNSLYKLGDVARAQAWAERALAVDPNDAGVLYNVACAFGVQGNADRAIELLERAVENGFGHREWIEHDPDLNALHDRPRFKALLDRL